MAFPFPQNGGVFPASAKSRAFLTLCVHVGDHFLSTALLLNEVSEKKSRNSKLSFRTFPRNLLRNLPRNPLRNFPCFPAWQVEKSSPKISGKEKAHKHKQIFSVTARVGGVFRPGGRGSPDRWSGVKSLCAVWRNPRNINVFVRVPGREESGFPAGRKVTGVTEKLFMCQMFMCLFRPLKFQRIFPSEISNFKSKSKSNFTKYLTTTISAGLVALNVLCVSAISRHSASSNAIERKSEQTRARMCKKRFCTTPL